MASTNVNRTRTLQLLSGLFLTARASLILLLGSCLHRDPSYTSKKYSMNSGFSRATALNLEHHRLTTQISSTSHDSHLTRSTGQGKILVRCLLCPSHGRGKRLFKSWWRERMVNLFS